MEEKTMMPINNQIEPDFLEHIKSTFKRWRDLNNQGVRMRAISSEVPKGLVR